MTITLTKNSETGEYDSVVDYDIEPNVDTDINDKIKEELNKLSHKLSYTLKSIDFAGDLNIAGATFNIDTYTHTIKQEIKL